MATKVSTTWDLTVNNYTDADIQLLQSWSDDVSRIVVSKEVGDSGTPHLQGRITFKRAYRLTGLKKLLGCAHWEPTKCTQDFLYVQKDGSEIVINVNNKKQGQRTDLEQAITAAREGGMKRAAAEHPVAVAKFHRGIEAVLRYAYDDPRDFAPEVYVRWGAPGSGKTRFIYDNFDVSQIWSKPTGDWFDGYQGHEVVIFDDFYGGVKYGEMLKLLDRYPMRVPIKGGFVQWRPRQIYFTSNVPPDQWYPNIVDTRALMRRLTTITQVGDAAYRGHNDITI
nr:MAG: replication polyprotein [Chemarfal virus 2]